MKNPRRGAVRKKQPGSNANAKDDDETHAGGSLNARQGERQGQAMQRTCVIRMKKGLKSN